MREAQRLNLTILMIVAVGLFASGGLCGMLIVALTPPDCPPCVEAEVVECEVPATCMCVDPPFMVGTEAPCPELRASECKQVLTMCPTCDDITPAGTRPCDNLFSMSAAGAGTMDLECALVGDGTAKFLGVTYVPQDSYRLAMISAEECGARLEQCCTGKKRKPCPKCPVCVEPAPCPALEPGVRWGDGSRVEPLPFVIAPAPGDWWTGCDEWCQHGDFWTCCKGGGGE